jgi:hypothetical protein
MNKSHQQLTESAAIPFGIIPNLSLRPAKAAGSEFSTRASLAANVLVVSMQVHLF